MNEAVELVMEYLDHIATARLYGVLTPRRGKIDVCLRNHSTKQIILLEWAAGAQNFRKGYQK